MGSSYKVESGERKIVGINHGVLEDEEMPPLLKPDPELGIRQSENSQNLEQTEIVLLLIQHWKPSQGPQKVQRIYFPPSNRGSQTEIVPW